MREKLPNSDEMRERPSVRLQFISAQTTALLELAYVKRVKYQRIK